MLVDGRTLWAERLGSDTKPPVLVLTGAAMQATTWEPVFTDPLVDAGYSVIRFDWRDIGRSSWQRFSEHPYTIDDLARDGFAVLDAHGLDTAHIVGFSMGGCVAQLMALASPDRVRALGLVSSGFASRIQADRGERGRRLFELFAEPRPANDLEHANRLVAQWRLLCGRAYHFDDHEWQARARAWIDRGQNLACPHLRLGPQVFGVDRHDELSQIRCPTLVLHGDDDPMFPLDHGRALAKTMPNAQLMELPGHGHDLHLHPEVAHALAGHLAAA